MIFRFTQIFKEYHLATLAYIFFVLGFFLLTLHTGMPDWTHYIPLFLALAPVVRSFYQKLKHRQMGSELFFIIATIIGVIGKQEQALTIVLLVLLFAMYLEEIVEERTTDAIESLIHFIPTDVIVRENEKDITMPIEAVHPGMLLVIKTGARIPVDGSIERGKASINEALLTGESFPKEKGPGQAVFAGTFVEAGSIIIKVHKVMKDTLFSKMTELLEQAGKRKARITILADRIGLILAPSFMLFVLLVWFITRNLETVITLLVFGSPLEIALVTPLTMLAGIVTAFKQGILVKGARSLEQCAAIDIMIFDKTGTLTIGEPKVASIHSLNPAYSDKHILLLAAIAEKRSEHVLAKAILKKAHEEELTIPDPDEYTSVTGHGIEIRYKERTYLLGNKHFIEDPEHGNIKIDQEIVCAPNTTAHSSFYLAGDQKLYGIICITDEIRQNAKNTIEELRTAGIKHFIVLSGDRPEVTQKIASQLGIHEAYGQVFPDEKLKKIEELQNTGRHVAMVGDGINDAPAIRQANVGIVMGAMGVEPAIEASDIALMNNDLHNLVFIYKLARKTIRIIKQNIIFGLFVFHGVGIILALARLLNPIQAALFHAVPDILIVLNSARLLRFKA